MHIKHGDLVAAFERGKADGRTFHGGDERELARKVTLIATMEGSPIGFASLEGKDKIGMLYVHPAVAGQGVGAMLAEALERLAGGRGVAKLKVDASDSARGFFEKRGYVAQQRNTVTVAGEWLANTTLQKQLAAQEASHG
jgi:putative acetyltransferase